jgi:hypothetical protein
MKVGGKNVLFLRHVSSKILNADVQFGIFLNVVFLLEITPISFIQNLFLFLNKLNLHSSLTSVLRQ